MKGILYKPWKIKYIAEHPDMEIQTRRLGGLKEINQADDNDWIFKEVIQEIGGRQRFRFKNTVYNIYLDAYPRYQVGETVYIKEKIARIGDYAVYFSDAKPVMFHLSANRLHWRWQGHYLSPLHLPEEAARYFIKILAVRAERLQEITLEDAKAEGMPLALPYARGNDLVGARNLGRIGCYQVIWNSINKDYPWESNPWVWVIAQKGYIER